LAGAPSSKSDPSASRSIPVLLDTNFLLLPFQRRIDIFEEIERLLSAQIDFIVLPQVMTEIHYLVQNGTTNEQRAAKGALELIKLHCRIPNETSFHTDEIGADEALLNFAKQMNAIVATNDRQLRKMLSKNGCRAIFLRKLAVLALSE
jgi:rRNA-processing protein FCF1